MTDPLYFDYNGSTPVHPAVKEVVLAWLDEGFGNAAAPHPAAQKARTALEQARATAAAAIGAHADSIVWTSGGTEANNHALFGGLAASGKGHLVVSAIEHKSVLSSAAALEARGTLVTHAPVTRAGAVDLERFEGCLREDTGLVAVMLANNETGVVQPIQELARSCRARGIPLLVDAVCALGRVPIDVEALGCDLLSLSSHKLYAPKGVGLLYVKPGTALEPLIYGCGQQDGRRSGTENTTGVLAFARALELMGAGQLPAPKALAALRDALWAMLERALPGVERNGSGELLANTLNVHFPGTQAAELQAALGARGISVAAGASAGTGKPSHVLVAMGHSPERAAASLRFSLGAATTEASLGTLVEALSAMVQPV